MIFIQKSFSDLRHEEANVNKLAHRALNKDEKTDAGQKEDGDELIKETLEGKVDPNSDVVNLLESMVVDDGNEHNEHPAGIAKIASGKGKVFGDTHDKLKLTPEQMKDLQISGTGKGRRNFMKSATLWTDKIIPYTIASSLSAKQSNVDVINKSIKQFTDYTCLKWVPYGSEEAKKASYSSYIEFFSESGCWSYVGRVNDGKQQISLQDPGCVTVSTTIHEMAHAIGQEHEQSRSDRDNYVTMLWANTNGAERNPNMAKSITHDYNPYDYESVLQYSLTSFSSNGEPTMKFRDRRLEFLADSATGLMFYDIQDVNDAYDCTKPCKGPKGDTPLKQCQNGGFVIHTCNCHCPGGLTGTLCETAITDAGTKCGPGIITLAEGETKTITSPNFNNGGPYPTGKKCVWLVKVSGGKKVSMTINEMDLTTNYGACDHWLEIQYNLIGQTGPRRCGKLSKETYVTSDNGDPSMMLLKFDSAFAKKATAGKGFSLKVTPADAATTRAPVSGKSTQQPKTTPQPTTPKPTVLFSCTFESGTTCFLQDITSKDEFNWSIGSGETPSNETGPSKAFEGTNYAYIEASGRGSGDTAVLESSPIQPIQTGDPVMCLSFAYHMYGSNIGSLDVIFDNATYFYEYDNKGNQWKQAKIDLAAPESSASSVDRNVPMFRQMS
ncbi:blastula protease 10-like [Ostrea edulis]|uniref:blastula protease 10-like n=1 Tax=Ostrea edulis TaxID=37623 RepID=UPI0020949F43|nr:blastula protease 10-like [Ostrea edulis]